MTTTTTMAEVPGLVGSELGSSDWHEVTQEHVNQFAEATGDHQWIHVDVERAKAESPFGGPIAHGYLTLSLLAPLSAQVLVVTDTVMGVNYGLNKVRFPSPVPVGSKVRLTASLKAVEEVTGGLQLTLAAVIEREAATSPSASPSRSTATTAAEGRCGSPSSPGRTRARRPTRPRRPPSPPTWRTRAPASSTAGGTSG